MTSEADLQNQVIDLAKLTGWLVHHGRPARTGKCTKCPGTGYVAGRICPRCKGSGQGWATPIQGDKGFMDLVLIRDRVVLAELKSAKGRLSPEQRTWIDAAVAAGAEVYVWRPADWDHIVEVLR